jgi:hypothetical protein
MRLKLIPVLFLAAIAVAVNVGAWGDDDDDDHCSSVVGTVTATLSNDPGFEGLWKYCITFDYDDDDGFDDSRGFEIFLPFDENCPCICTPDLIRFPDIAGHAPGNDWYDDDDDGQCTFIGYYNCLGDTTAPSGTSGPSISFGLPPSGNGYDDDDSECDTDDSGTAEFCFYSALPPGPSGSYPIGSGDDSDDDDGDGDSDEDSEDDGQCTGYITGQLPSCDCSVPTRSTTWGNVKSRFEN